MRSWTAQAACGTSDPELFFPSLRSSYAGIRQAKRICHDCPVKQQCLQEALEVEVTGIWGGLDESERRRLRRQRVVAA